jgi:hypothetical protein
MDNEDNIILPKTENKKLHIHDLYKSIGVTGRFQFKIIIIMCLNMFLIAFFFQYLGFVFKTPVFLCPTNSHGTKE